MKIHNVRYGFATNSSSSHSVVLAPGLSDTNKGDLGFGWDNFICASPEAKRRYLFTAAYLHYTRNLSSKEAAILARALFPVSDRDFDAAAGESGSYNGDCYIDHQSKPSFPDPRRPHIGMVPLWELFDQEIAQANGVAIMGGNDNQENEDWKPKCAYYAPEIALWDDLAQAGSSMFDVDKGTGHFTLFNRRTGKKVRILPEGVAAPAVAAVPELVDLKITDYCPVGCSFCAVPGTEISMPSGSSPIEKICVGDAVITGSAQGDGVASVAEVYERDVDEDIITIELDDGRELRLTENHEVWTTNRGWVTAGELTELDDLKVIDYCSSEEMADGETLQVLHEGHQ